MMLSPCCYLKIECMFYFVVPLTEAWNFYLKILKDFLHLPHNFDCKLEIHELKGESCASLITLIMRIVCECVVKYFIRYAESFKHETMLQNKWDYWTTNPQSKQMRYTI
jgi:hypothetical protein